MSKLIALPPGLLSQLLLHLQPGDWSSLSQTCRDAENCVNKGMEARKSTLTSETVRVMEMGERILKAAKARIDILGEDAPADLNWQCYDAEVQMNLLKNTCDLERVSLPPFLKGKELAVFSSLRALKVHKQTPVVIERLLRALQNLEALPFNDMLRQNYPLLRRSIATIARENQLPVKNGLGIRELLKLIRAERYKEAIEEICAIHNEAERALHLRIFCSDTVKKGHIPLVLTAIDQLNLNDAAGQNKGIIQYLVYSLFPHIFVHYERSENEPEMSHYLELSLELLHRGPETFNSQRKTLIFEILKKNQLPFLQKFLQQVNKSRPEFVSDMLDITVNELAIHDRYVEMIGIANVIIGDLCAQIDGKFAKIVDREKMTGHIKNHVLLVINCLREKHKEHAVIDFLNQNIGNVEVHYYYIMSIIEEALDNEEEELATLYLNQVFVRESEAYALLAHHHMRQNNRLALSFIKCILDDEMQKRCVDEMCSRLIGSRDYTLAIMTVETISDPLERANRLWPILHGLLNDIDIDNWHLKVEEIIKKMTYIPMREKAIKAYVSNLFFHAIHEHFSIDANIEYVMNIIVNKTLHDKTITDLLLKELILQSLREGEIEEVPAMCSTVASFVVDADIREEMIALLSAASDTLLDPIELKADDV